MFYTVYFSYFSILTVNGIIKFSLFSFFLCWIYIILNIHFVLEIFRIKPLPQSKSLTCFTSFCISLPLPFCFQTYILIQLGLLDTDFLKKINEFWYSIMFYSFFPLHYLLYSILLRVIFLVRKHFLVSFLKINDEY